MAESKKVTIEIEGLTEAQALAIEDLLHLWESLGNDGSSRWTAFFADGDGDFRPKILIDERFVANGRPIGRYFQAEDEIADEKRLARLLRRVYRKGLQEGLKSMPGRIGYRWV